jgi:hypothetical protein
MQENRKKKFPDLGIFPARPSFADGHQSRRQSDHNFADGQPSAKPFLITFKKTLCRRLL